MPVHEYLMRRGPTVRHDMRCERKKGRDACLSQPCTPPHLLPLLPPSSLPTIVHLVLSLSLSLPVPVPPVWGTVTHLPSHAAMSAQQGRVVAGRAGKCKAVQAQWGKGRQRTSMGRVGSGGGGGRENGQGKNQRERRECWAMAHTVACCLPMSPNPAHGAPACMKVAGER